MSNQQQQPDAAPPRNQAYWFSEKAQASNALVLFSGGLDSTICLYMARAVHNKVHALCINYGQCNAAELDAAVLIIDRVKPASYEVCNVGPLFDGDSPLVNHAKPVGQYQSFADQPGGIDAAFVPGRNLAFLAIAANRAYNLNCNKIYMGITKAAHDGFPDCRASTMASMQLAISTGLDRGIEICTPFIHMEKADELRFAGLLPGCMDAIAFSQTCYIGSPPCGKCHACLGRAEGFESAGFPDPLLERLRHP